MIKFIFFPLCQLCPLSSTGLQEKLDNVAFPSFFRHNNPRHCRAAVRFEWKFEITRIASQELRRLQFCLNNGGSNPCCDEKYRRNNIKKLFSQSCGEKQKKGANAILIKIWGTDRVETA